MIIRKCVYKLLKRGKIREFHTKLTIVNAKDSLWTIVQNFRPIVEFPGEGLGYSVQKYDGFENIEKRSRALEVTLGSSTDTNLGHNHTKI